MRHKKLNSLRATMAVAFALFAVNIAVAATPSGGMYQTPSVDNQRRAVQESVSKSVGHKIDNPLLYQVLLDRVERDFTDKGDFSHIEGQGWLGSSTNRLWVKGEGSRQGNNTKDANIEAYYSHAVAAYWDAQIGARHDFSDQEAPSRDWLGIGFEGLAPYKFETSVTAYFGGAGRTAMRLTGEYDFFVTQRLIFWPELEVNLYGKDDPRRRLGRGLSDGRLALRLRYEIRREFAPYVGVQWTRKFARTADYLRESGEAIHDAQIVAGLRVWW